MSAQKELQWIQSTRWRWYAYPGDQNTADISVFCNRTRGSRWRIEIFGNTHIGDTLSRKNRDGFEYLEDAQAEAERVARIVGEKIGTWAASE